MNKLSLSSIKKYLKTLYTFSKTPVFLLEEDLTYVSFSNRNGIFKEEALSPLYTYIDNQPNIMIVNETELFASFPCVIEGVHYHVGFGPGILHIPQAGDYKALKIMSSRYSVAEIEDRINTLPLTTLSTFNAYINFIYFFITGLDISQYQTNIIQIGDSMNSPSDLHLFPSFSDASNANQFSVREKHLLEIIGTGNLSQLDIDTKSLTEEFTLRLSKDPIENLKLNCISLLSLVSRKAIESHVETPIALNLYSTYVQSIHTTTSYGAIEDDLKEALRSFTREVLRAQKEQFLPPLVRSVMFYVKSSIYENIKVSDIANEIGFSEAYLSTQFKKHYGISLKKFIHLQKIEESKNLLQNSDYQSVEIASLLGFSSSSHFSRVFKSLTGVTPQVYRSAL